MPRNSLLLQAGRSDFHVHTCASDAKPDCTPDRIVQVAEGLRMKEIGFTDHLLACNADAKGCGQAPGDVQAFSDVCEQVRRINSPVRTYVSWEVDYFDGGLYSFDPDQHLDMLDYVLLGHHYMSHMFQETVEKMARYLLDIHMAMAQEPYAHIIAHPFYVPPPPERHGAILQHISDTQLAEVFCAMKEHGKAAEITAYQLSADLRAVDQMCRAYAAARETGVKFTLDSDAHSLRDIGGSLRCSYVLASLGFCDQEFVDYEGLMALKKVMS